MGLPDRSSEREILTGQGGNEVFADLRPVADPATVAAAIATVHQVYCAAPLIEYVLDLVAATRNHPGLGVGASPRAAVGLVQAARAHAVVAGRHHVTPDDVQAVVVPAFAHRVSVGGTVDTAGAARVLGEIAARTPVPRP
jgi:MoxR-like ATPase